MKGGRHRESPCPKHEDGFIWQLRKTTRGHRMLVHRMAEKYGLYQGQMIIMSILMHNDGCTQKEIADAMNVTPPTMAMSIKRMEKTGYIEKRQDEKDLRINRIYLTPKGKKVNKEIKGWLDDYDRRIVGGFTQEEFDLLSEFFNRINRNLDELLEDATRDMSEIKTPEKEVDGI